MSQVKDKKILIVDDTDTMRAVARHTLSEAGFTNITTCTNGRDALLGLLKVKMDLIICDWEMPEMSGLEVLTELKNNEKTKNIHFLMMTGTADAEKVKQAVQAKVDGYILKPFKPKELLERVTNLLS